MTWNGQISERSVCYNPNSASLVPVGLRRVPSYGSLTLFFCGTSWSGFSSLFLPILQHELWRGLSGFRVLGLGVRGGRRVAQMPSAVPRPRVWVGTVERI